jgi:hypothetical protein
MGDLILLPETLHHFEAMEPDAKNKLEKVWSDYFETSVCRKIDLSLIF